MIKGKGVYLFISQAENYHSVSLGLFSQLAKKPRQKGIYISLNKGYSQIKEHLKKNHIKTSNLFFIVSSKNKECGGEDCRCIPGAESLTSLSLAITAAIDTGGFDYVILDSINTLLVYNDQKTVQKFVHYLVGKLKSFGVAGILIGVEDDSFHSLKPMLTQFCDNCVTF